MERDESTKMESIDTIPDPQGVSIDANEQMNQETIKYKEFLEWLKLAGNHELFVRIKKFVASVNEITPKATYSEREVQSEMLNLRINSFTKEALSPEEFDPYGKYLRKLIHVMCYQQMLSCLPSHKDSPDDFFLSRCRALSHFISFASLGHDNRYTLSQYKEFWDCAVEQLRVMSVYRFVDDKVTCLNNTINILTRLLETLFGVAGADELMDGICLVVIRSQVPRLKLQLQLMDFYYEECEEKRGAFESVKLRIRGIISFVKGCKVTDFCGVPASVWEANMGREGEGLSRRRRASELSSDDMMEVVTPEEEEEEEERSVQLSLQSQRSQRSAALQTIRRVFNKKTKKIVDGKWMECLEPMPLWTESEKANNDLVMQWKTERYQFYKQEPAGEEEEKKLYDEYRNVVRTVENLLYLLRRWVVCLRGEFIYWGGIQQGSGQ
ncbi:hypothetical protein WA556_000363 [Blastocystis sp. ATCC 50177/Nand II]